MICTPGPSRRHAFADDSDRIGAPEPALFLDVTDPVPFACVEWFLIAGLIDELNYYLSPLNQEQKIWVSTPIAVKFLS